jgi:hypothetical protein
LADHWQEPSLAERRSWLTEQSLLIKSVLIERRGVSNQQQDAPLWRTV